MDRNRGISKTKVIYNLHGKLVYLPDPGTTYYFISHDGLICKKNWNQALEDLNRYDAGNYFETEQEARSSELIGD